MHNTSLTNGGRRHVGRDVDAPLSRRAGLAVVALSGIVSLGAVYGGVGLLVEPERLGVKQSWLEGTPFPDYAAPGVVLLVVVGGGMLLTALSALRRSRLGGLAALAMGVTLLVWGGVETVTIGYQGVGQLVLLGVFVIGPALPLIAIGWRATTLRSSPHSMSFRR